ncbi:MAG: hypothetical protein WD267_07820 [Balneolales bacterium]
MAKRTSKEQLETDALLTTYVRFVGFVQKNLVAVIAGTVIILLLIGGGIWYYLNLQSQEVEAQDLLVVAERYFDSGDYESALYGDQANFSAGFVEIIDNYGRTDAANIARFYAAVSALRLGDHYSALEFIEQFDPPSGILGVGPISLHGTILANLGEHEAAARQYEKAANWDRNSSTTPENLLFAAQAALEAGNQQAAQEYLDQIIREYEDSSAARQALSLQGTLEARS